MLEGDIIHDLLTFEEVRALIDACKKEEDRLLLRLLWSTGLRVGEVEQLKIE